MSAETVAAMADQLRQYATHFEMRDWDYTRDLGHLTALRYDYANDTRWGRIKQSLRWLTRRTQEWERVLKVGRFAMARHVLGRDNHLPGCLLPRDTTEDVAS